MLNSTYFALGSKNSFNLALRHFYKVNDLIDDIESHQNIADLINVQLDEEEIQMDQVLPVIGSIIRDKYQYTYHSFDIPVSINDFAKITDETSKWTALDVVMVYYNPNGQIYVINPKNEDAWERVRELACDHLVVIYAKYLKGDGDPKIEKEAITAIEEMIAGKDVYINKDFVDASVAPRRAAKPSKPAPQAVAGAPKPTGKRRATPKYSVQVTNELFHNGNVEAWKKIIQSFNAKHPDLEVIIFYEGELINDINALFKWGKVKHHGLIMFQVVGENIRNVSKLQKYLFEGASQRFEQFLKGQVGQVLNLF
ncbi:MAG TPA: hypothetical protein P5123_03020 [Spirochaetota bacterium]|nr:hypothetical protein [Spirochaetota bacterium]